MTKMAKMALPHNIYNWIKDFFGEHHHCTKYAGVSSTEAAVTSSVIQGSGLGPASYLVAAADLHPVHSGNSMFKFADDPLSYQHRTRPGAKEKSNTFNSGLM